MKKITLLIGFAFLTLGIINAQEAPFYKDIQHFKELDTQTPPPARPILFIGSSSFTKWKDVNDYFPGYTIVNRGFGGSTLKDQLYYFTDLVPVYKPRQVIIYCGENDLANEQTPADSALFRFKKLYAMIRDYDKNVPIAFISIKPSPSRAKYFDKMKAANAAIKAFIKTQKQVKYINVFDAMLGADGAPLPDIFIEDRLHMNAKGYHIWQKIMQPYLLK